MAEKKARHAFGALEKIDHAILSGAIDAYDILFVKNADGKPFIGWVDKDGNKVICDDSAEFDALLEQISTKASIEDLAEVDAKIATKVDATEVDAKVDKAVGDAMTEMTTLVEEKVEEKIAEVNAAYEIVEF